MRRETCSTGAKMIINTPELLLSILIETAYDLEMILNTHHFLLSTTLDETEHHLKEQVYKKMNEIIKGLQKELIMKDVWTLHLSNGRWPFSIFIEGIIIMEISSQQNKMEADKNTTVMYLTWFMRHFFKIIPKEALKNIFEHEDLFSTDKKMIFRSQSCRNAIANSVDDQHLWKYIRPQFLFEMISPEKRPLWHILFHNLNNLKEAIRSGYFQECRFLEEWNKLFNINGESISLDIFCRYHSELLTITTKTAPTFFGRKPTPAKMQNLFELIRALTSSQEPEIKKQKISAEEVSLSLR